MGLCTALVSGLHRRFQAISEDYAMDVERTETLTHSAPTEGSRRRAMAAVLGGSLAALGLRDTVGRNRKRKKHKKHCPTCATCPPPTTCPPPDTCPRRICCQCATGCKTFPSPATTADCDTLCGPGGSTGDASTTLATNMPACDVFNGRCTVVRC